MVGKGPGSVHVRPAIALAVSDHGCQRLAPVSGTQRARLGTGAVYKESAWSGITWPLTCG